MAQKLEVVHQLDVEVKGVKQTVATYNQCSTNTLESMYLFAEIGRPVTWKGPKGQMRGYGKHYPKQVTNMFHGNLNNLSRWHHEDQKIL